MICSGENGYEVAEFANQKIPAEILFGQLNNCTPDEVKDVLRQAFVSAERDYLNSIDEYLAEKTELQCQIPENISQYDVIVSSTVCSTGQFAKRDFVIKGYSICRPPIATRTF